MRSVFIWLVASAPLAASVACGQITGISDLQIDDAFVEGGPASSDAGDSGVPGSDATPGVDARPPGDGSVADQSAGDAPGTDSGPPPPPACTATGGPALVRLGAFCIDATEVTNDQYAAFLASSPPTTLAPSPACSYKTSFTPSSAWPPSANKASSPVVYVDWCDAYAFCAWAGKHLCGAIGGGASSKANVANKNVDEWYVACSKDGANVYPYGGNTYVSGKCNDWESGTRGTRAVGTFSACQGGYSGIFDMNGNAYEWEDACDVSAGASDSCVIRGGSWNFTGAGYGGCNTYFNDYTVKRSDSYNDTGFRCCDR